MALTLRQLEIFLETARVGNVTQAAGNLVLSQSAVSMSLGELERSLGNPLFDRVGRELVLNHSGARVREYAAEILDRTKELENFALSEPGRLVGSLTVAASTTIGNYLLPAWIGEFQTLHPETEIILEVQNTRDVADSVRSYKCDLGFIEGPTDLTSLEKVHFLFDEMVVVGGKGHPLSQTEEASKKDWREQLWILREEGSGTRVWFENQMIREGIEIQKTMELGHTEAIKKLVEAGLGVSCLSKLAVEREIQNGWLVSLPVFSGDWKRELDIIIHKKKYRSTLLEAFLEFCLGKEAPT